MSDKHQIMLLGGASAEAGDDARFMFVVRDGPIEQFLGAALPPGIDDKPNVITALTARAANEVVRSREVLSIPTYIIKISKRVIADIGMYIFGPEEGMYMIVSGSCNTCRFAKSSIVSVTRIQ